MTSDRRVHAFEEIAKHNKRKDCWIIVSGKVYDVSQFMEDHPGGEEVLIAVTGRDATSDYEDIGHSDEARRDLGKYCIGEVDMATVPLKRYSHLQHDIPKGSLAQIENWHFLLLLFILGLAYAYILPNES